LDDFQFNGPADIAPADLEAEIAEGANVSMNRSRGDALSCGNHPDSRPSAEPLSRLK
jgi:hypothetical protein